LPCDWLPGVRIRCTLPHTRHLILTPPPAEPQVRDVLAELSCTGHSVSTWKQAACCNVTILQRNSQSLRSAKSDAFANANTDSTSIYTKKTIQSECCSSRHTRNQQTCATPNHSLLKRPASMVLHRLPQNSSTCPLKSFWVYQPKPRLPRGCHAIRVQIFRQQT
jgi:hypothetical protein